MSRRRVAAAITVLAASGIAGGTAQAQGSGVCDPDALLALAAEREPESDPGQFGGIGAVRCFDATGDGLDDAVFTIESGGTGGAFWWGIAIDDGAGAPQLVLLQRPASKLGVSRQGRNPEVGFPLYRRGDANCCPTGGYRIKRYRWTGTRFKHVKTRRVSRAPRRFYVG